MRWHRRNVLSWDQISLDRETGTIQVQGLVPPEVSRRWAAGEFVNETVIVKMPRRAKVTVTQVMVTDEVAFPPADSYKVEWSGIGSAEFKRRYKT